MSHHVEAQTPSPTWERFVVWAKRARIRRYPHSARIISISDGNREGVPPGRPRIFRALEGVLKNFHCATVEDLYRDWPGLATGRAVINAAFPQPREVRTKVVSLARAAHAKRNEMAVPTAG